MVTSPRTKNETGKMQRKYDGYYNFRIVILSTSSNVYLANYKYTRYQGNAQTFYYGTISRKFNFKYSLRFDNSKKNSTFSFLNIESFLEISCPILNAPAQSIKNSNGDPILGNVVTFKCNQGYKQVSSAQRVCAADGKWSGTQARCEGDVMWNQN